MSQQTLIIGSTGFLGGALLSRLIDLPRWDDLLLLVRCHSSEGGAQSLVHTLKRYEVPAQRIARLRPEQILCGDLVRVDAFANDPRLRDVVNVVNCAAITTFGKHPLLWETNVDGVLALANLVTDKARNLRRFVHLGTAMCCGVDAPNPVPEGYVPEGEIEHLVDYTASKLEAELRLRREIPELPLIVMRPSIVVGHSTLGCKPSASIFWVFRMALMLEHFTCSLDQRIDVVPVDHCADAILHVLDLKHPRHDLYHVAAGPERSNTFREIDAAIAKTAGRLPLHHYRQVDFTTLVAMQDQFQTIFGPCNKRLMLRAMRTYGAFATLGMIFQAERLRAEGLPVPPRFADYAGLCALTAQDESVPEQMKVDFR